ncbi:hypothetical protein ACFPTR_11095 [Aliibacillus thermotolerans]|uniref:Fur-regulated basic protein FbpA n=1 Tax=Aliibacillus thermotolerans TaxID=1834418 RepID=A0ABW0U7G3_9BACI|nr:hypothetical protein [Aliibacillus thermotolerans]MDA3129726.1 hypothetical protein [Aliibacillus thermotolerans]
MHIIREQELQNEFERKLQRPLNSEEKLFVQWMIEQQEKEHGFSFVEPKN